ncbi:hypothetical protein ACFL1I_03755 [Candidatus Omnitrophota bacterium]
MEGLGVELIKVLLMVFTAAGLAFHLLAFRSPESGKKLEQRLGTEIGSKKKFIPWLEENRMELQDKLIHSAAYHIFAIIFLIILLVLLVQI